MTKEQFIQSIENTYKTGVEIIKRKNADYAGDLDPFKNFRSAEVVGVDVKQAILVRVLDKISRAGNVISKGETQVKEETVTDTIEDCINYLAILKAYIEHEAEKTR